jgi:hypothetical protein
MYGEMNLMYENVKLEKMDVEVDIEKKMNEINKK